MSYKWDNPWQETKGIGVEKLEAVETTRKATRCRSVTAAVRYDKFRVISDSEDSDYMQLLESETTGEDAVTCETMASLLPNCVFSILLTIRTS